jgi:hypothetical protein
MAKDKNVIDEALDSAEELIADKKSDQEPEAAEPEPKAEEPEVVEPEVEAPIAEPESEAEPGIEPPRFWSAEKKALFAKAPLEVQQAVLEYEQQRTEWANRLASESEQGRSYRQKVEETFKPYQERLKAEGISDPIQAAAQLLEWNEAFEKDPVSGVISLMQENGITLEDLYGVINSGGSNALPPNNSYRDPRIEQALAEAAEAKKLASEQMQLIQAAQQQAFLSEIERFKNGKDSSGNPRKQFAEMYAPQISQVAEQIQKITPGVTLYDALEHAYEQVLSNAKKAFGVSLAQPKPEKAKAAASSVMGAPLAGGVVKKPKAKTIDEALDMAEEQLGAR